MRAMIFAAGKGTRLKPITDLIPKALVKIKGKTLLEITINKLKRYGFNEIIINVHHFSLQILDYLQRKNYFDINIKISDETDLLLDTGGGLKQAKNFLNGEESFLVHNVDVLSDINLNTMMNHHLSQESLATIAVRNRETQRYFLFNDNNLLCGWQNIKTGEKIISRKEENNLTPLAFSGVHIINPKIFELMPDTKIFSMVDLYLNLCTEHKISAYRHDDTAWIDIGKPESLKKAEELEQIFNQT